MNEQPSGLADVEPEEEWDEELPDECDEELPDAPVPEEPEVADPLAEVDVVPVVAPPDEAPVDDVPAAAPELLPEEACEPAGVDPELLLEFAAVDPFEPPAVDPFESDGEPLPEKSPGAAVPQATAPASATGAPYATQRRIASTFQLLGDGRSSRHVVNFQCPRTVCRAETPATRAQ